MFLEAVQLEPIVQQLQTISKELSKTDWLGWINIILVPISIWLTSYITLKQSRKLLEIQTQHEFEVKIYEDTSESLAIATEIYLSDLENKTRAMYSLKNFISNYFICDKENSDIVVFDNYPKEEYIELSSKLSNIIMSNRTNLSKFRKSLIDTQSFFDKEHEINKVIQLLINFIDSKIDDTDKLAMKVMMIHTLDELSITEVNELFNEISETFYPFDSNLFSSNWKKLISQLNHRKVKP